LQSHDLDYWADEIDEPDDDEPDTKPCPVCNGRGRDAAGNVCDVCSGTGRVPADDDEEEDDEDDEKESLAYEYEIED
jgi:hypothetical protein